MPTFKIIKLQKTFRIIRITLASLVALVIGLLIILASVNLMITAKEKSNNPAPGKFVEVNGKKMHLFTEGKGKKNVVLLGGWGNPSPVVMFRPMINALKSDFTVTVVENFGYGWSDWTDAPRTNEAVAEETRTALREAGVLPPYILVPHSISGLYTLAFARAHPEEVEAIVGLDSTVSDNGKYFPPERWNLYGIARVMGLVRVALWVSPSQARLDSPEFSEPDQKQIAMMAKWNLGNGSSWDEFQRIAANCSDLDGYRIPRTIPALFVLSKESVEQCPKIMPGLDWVKAHQVLIEGNEHGQIAILKGSHFIQFGNTEKIADLIKGVAQIANRDTP